MFLTPRNKQTLCVLEKISAVEFLREKKKIVVAQKHRAALKELQRFKKLLTFCGAAEGKGIKNRTSLNICVIPQNLLPHHGWKYSKYSKYSKELLEALDELDGVPYQLDDGG